jgi:hypothetical protein
MKTAAYTDGATDALESFGIRVAADLMSRQMPEGPGNLGAEWLARTLSSQADEYKTRPNERSPRKLERPVRWGPKVMMGQGPEF